MIYSLSDIAILREGGKRLATVLDELVAMVRPGVTTSELDAHAEKRIRELGGVPSFLGYKGSFAATGFVSTICASINEEVVHGPAVPSRTLKEGDIIGIDIGMRYPAAKGLCTDMAATVAVGAVSAEVRRLIDVTRESLEKGIAAAGPGVQVKTISRAIQQHVEQAGFAIVRDLVGHGVGKKVHEEPEIPNFVIRGPIGDFVLRPGQVIAIEPMVNMGRPEVETLDDGWTVAASDRSLSAHFEHTIAITEQGAELLTAR